MKKRVCYVDADTILYTSAVVQQENTILVGYGEKPNKRSFKNRTAFKSWLDLNPKWIDTKHLFTIEDVATLTGSVALAMYNVGLRIRALQESPYISEVKFCIGGNDMGNFRGGIAKMQPYKGQRGDKPLVLKELQESVARKWKDIVVQPKSSVEVDDIMSCIGWKEFKQGSDGVMLSYIDKDLHQIPGWRIDYNNYELPPFYIDELQAFRNLAQQSLSGDACDNIVGIHKVAESVRKYFGLRGSGGFGKDSAIKVLKDCTNIKEIAERVVWIYKESYPSGYVLGDGTTMSHMDVADENFKLLKLTEYDGHDYVFSKECVKMGINIGNK